MNPEINNLEPLEKIEEAKEVSQETMAKTIEQLEEEEKTLRQAVATLTSALTEAKSEDEFKSINGKLRGNKDLLEEVEDALWIKNQTKDM